MADDKTTKRYYWLKLRRDFFKRHDMRIVEEMDNGKDYVLFYLKMLVESIDHEGELRFSETIPYNEKMLSVVTNTNVDIVRSAMKLFVELGMIELLDDATIFMGEVQKMIGNETAGAERTRKSRANNPNKSVKLLQCNADVTKCNTEIDTETDSDTEIRDIKELVAGKPQKPTPKRFVPPTLEEVTAYCKERNKGIDAEKFWHFYNANDWMRGKTKIKRWQSAVITWEKNDFGNKQPQQPESNKKFYVGE